MQSSTSVAQNVAAISGGRVNGTVSYLNPDAEYGFVLPAGWTYDDAKFFRKDVLPSLWLHLQVGSPVSFEILPKQNASSRHRAMRVAGVDDSVPLGAEEIGRVKSFDKGIGFLVPDNELIATLVGDVFFHKNSVETALAGIAAGVEVTFRLSASRTKAGKFEAVSVRVSPKQTKTTTTAPAQKDTKPLVPPPSLVFEPPPAAVKKTETSVFPSGTGKDAWDDDDEPTVPTQKPSAAVAHNSAHSFLVYQDAIEEFVEIISGWGADLVGAPLHHSITPLPTTFPDISHYFSSFLPLLFEDVRAQMHTALERQAKKPSSAQAKVVTVGWKSAPTGGEGKLLLRVTSIPGTHFLDCCLVRCGSKFTHLGVVQRTDRDGIEFRIRVMKIDPNTHELPAVGSQMEIVSLMSLASAQRVYGALRSSVAPAHLAPMLIDPKRIKSLNQVRSWDELPQRMEDRIATNFNPSQQEALRAFAELQEGVLLVQGPPGTGKTSTILGLVGVALFQNSRVLICSPSNAAVDELVIRISQLGVLSAEENKGNQNGSYFPELSLLGNHEKIDTSHEKHLDHALLQTRRERLLNLLKPVVDEGAKKWTELTLQKFESELRPYFAERHIRRWCSELKIGSSDYGAAAPLLKAFAERLTLKSDDFDMELLNASEVVCCTLSASGRSIMRRPELKGFDVVLIDEAAQGTEAETLVPLREHCKRIVLVGDPAQLPATVTSEVAQKAHYDRSLQARIMGLLDGTPNAKGVLLMLRTQYRMHPLIRQWPSSHFYHNLLDDAPGVKNNAPVNSKYGNLVFLDCLSGVEERDPVTLSLRNTTEAAVVVDVLKDLLSSSPLEASQVGVITFYAAQAALLRQQLNQQHLEKTLISTVDSFQGKEKEVIVLSFVRSNVASAVGFLRDMRRLNVALTRAKRSLILIGHSQTLSTHPDLKSLIEFLQTNHLLREMKVV